MIGKILLVLLAVVALTQTTVVVLDDSNYTSFVEEHPYVFVKFFAPWCGHCKSMAPDYEKLATVSEGKEYVIAEVDATVSPNVTKEVGVEGYPTLKFVVNGYPMDYDGGRDFEGMKKWIESTMESEIVKISEEELKNLIGTTDFVLIQGATSDQLKSLRFAKALGGGTKFYALEGEDFKITLHLKGSKTFEYTGEISIKDLADWTVTNTMGSLVALTGSEVMRHVFENKKSLPSFLLLKNGDWTEPLSEVLTEFCEENNDKFVCAFADQTHEIHQGISKFMKISSNDFSILAFFDFGIKNGWKVPNPTEITKESLLQFYEDVIAGKIQQFHGKDKEAAPEKIEYQNVLKLTAENYNDTIKNNKQVFIEYYSSGCGHCIAFAPEYEKLATHFKEQNSDIVIAAVNMNEEEEVANWVNVNGYPTLRFNFNGVELDYNEDRKAENIVDYIDKVTKFKLKTKNTKEDLEKPVVAVYGISQTDPLQLLPFKFTRYPVYWVLEESEFKVEVLDKKFAQYTGDRDLDAVANWLEETTEEVIVNIVEEFPSKKLNKALENQSPLLVIINRDNSDAFKSAFAILQSFCEGKIEYVCGIANKDDKEYSSFNEWISDPDNEKSRLLYLDTKDFKKYLYNGDLASLTEDIATQFLADVKDGKIEAHKGETQDMQEETPEGGETGETSDIEVEVVQEGEETAEEVKVEETAEEL